MKKNLSPLKIVAIVAGSIFTVLVLLFILGTIVGPQQRTKREKNKEADTTQKVTEAVQQDPEYVLTEQDYIRHYQSRWDSVKLEKDEWSYSPKYGKYTEELSKINMEMKTFTDSDPQNFKELEKLRMKFVESKKWKDADRDWLTYGEPKMEYDLVEPCETYLQTLGIDGYKREKSQVNRTKSGYKVKVQYSGKNLFGTRVREVSTFDVRFNPVNNTYYANSVK